MPTFFDRVRRGFAEIAEEFRTKPTTREYKEGEVAYREGYSEAQCPYGDKESWRREQWIAGLKGR